MNYAMIYQVLARVTGLEAVLMLIPLGIAFYQQEPVKGFLTAEATAVILSIAFWLIRPEKTAISAREGLTGATLSWVTLSVIGAIPLRIDGGLSWVDALFETIAGFTTTGASIIPGGPESLGMGLLFWRSLTHWLGGMGVLIFMMALLPMAKQYSMHIVRAEITGPVAGKLVPRVHKTAMILYSIYVILTFIETIALKCVGLSWYDALIHSFGTACTGGFSNYNNSIAHFNSIEVEFIIGVFMLLFGINFNLYFFIFVRKFKEFFKNEELWCYLGAFLIGAVAITCNIHHQYENWVIAMRYGFFQTAAIISTTGYVTADFTLWPAFSQWVMLALMLCGGCAGSTGCGIKVARFIILRKAAAIEIKRLLRPRTFEQVRLNNAEVDKSAIHNTLIYTYFYVFAAMACCLTLSLTESLDFATISTSAVACLSNIGYGMGLISPSGSFNVFSDFGKMVLCFCMLLGRLEIYPVLLTMAVIFRRRR